MIGPRASAPFRGWPWACPAPPRRTLGNRLLRQARRCLPAGGSVPPRRVWPHYSDCSLRGDPDKGAPAGPTPFGFPTTAPLVPGWCANSLTPCARGPGRPTQGPRQSQRQRQLASNGHQPRSAGGAGLPSAHESWTTGCGLGRIRSPPPTTKSGHPCCSVLRPGCCASAPPTSAIPRFTPTT